MMNLFTRLFEFATSTGDSTDTRAANDSVAYIRTGFTCCGLYRYSMNTYAYIYLDTHHDIYTYSYAYTYI